MSSNDQFLFLISTLHQDSIEEHERQEARARAHAARKTHARLRSEAGGPRKWVKREDTFTSQSSIRARTATGRPDLGQIGSSLLRVAGHPGTTLDNGRGDPFNTFSVSDMPPYMFSLLDIAARYKWSRVKPTAHDSNVNPVAKAWMSAAVESPVALHALVYAMLRTILLVRKTPGPETMLVLQHYAECLSNIRKEMQSIANGTSSPTDNLIIGIAGLAAHGEPHDAASPGSTSEGRMSPLAKTQNLNVYGLGSMEHEHMQGVYLLVAAKGGLQNITLNGLTDVLEVVDLCFATRAHTTPKFEWRHSTSPSNLDRRYSPDHHALHMLKRLGTGFHEIKELQCLSNTVRCMQDVIIALDQYHRKGQDSPNLPALLKARNGVQHHLLCLPLTDLLSNDNTAESFLYEICRLGFLIFSNMVLFPLPMESGVAERLVKKLRARLLNNPMPESDMWSRHSAVLTWVVVMGAIASPSPSERQWYVHYLGNHIPTAYTFDWQFLEEEILSKYIWWRYICSDLSEKIWAEACSVSLERLVGHSPL